MSCLNRSQQHQFKTQAAGDAAQEINSMLRTTREGQVVFSLDDDFEIESALKHIFNTTEVGQDYQKNYASMARIDEDYDKLVRAASTIAGGSFIHEGHLQHALTLLIDSGELRPKKVTPVATFEEPEEDTRPRDRNGKLLTEAQIAWGEMARFAETASMVDISRRKASDPAFANFVRKNLEREMAQEIGDRVEPAGQSAAKARVSNELTEFASAYNREPIANLRPRNGFVLLGGNQIPWATFNDLLSRATAANLV
jgi:hypothetical protein